MWTAWKDVWVKSRCLIATNRPRPSTRGLSTTLKGISHKNSNNNSNSSNSSLPRDIPRRGSSRSSSSSNKYNSSNSSNQHSSSRIARDTTTTGTSNSSRLSLALAAEAAAEDNRDTSRNRTPNRTCNNNKLLHRSITNSSSSIIRSKFPCHSTHRRRFRRLLSRRPQPFPTRSRTLPGLPASTMARRQTPLS
jgi:hypothetical protein